MYCLYALASKPEESLSDALLCIWGCCRSPRLHRNEYVELDHDLPTLVIPDSGPGTKAELKNLSTTVTYSDHPLGLR